MPVNVNFIYATHSTMGLAPNGWPIFIPHLSTDKRLYVIRNPNTARKRYIGTAVNLKARFEHRLQVLKELGFGLVDLTGPKVHPVRVTINGIARTVDSTGCVYPPGLGEIDVEHLLIRIYITNTILNLTRNSDKTGTFDNPVNQALNWTLTAPGGPPIKEFAGVFVTNGTIANGASL